MMTILAWHQSVMTHGHHTLWLSSGSLDSCWIRMSEDFAMPRAPSVTTINFLLVALSDARALLQAGQVVVWTRGWMGVVLDTCWWCHHIVMCVL